jgi:hypothetical protein
LHVAHVGDAESDVFQAAAVAVGENHAPFPQEGI